MKSTDLCVHTKAEIHLHRVYVSLMSDDETGKVFLVTRWLFPGKCSAAISDVKYCICTTEQSELYRAAESNRKFPHSSREKIVQRNQTPKLMQLN